MERNHIFLEQQDLKPQLIAYTVKEEKRPVKQMENGITALLTNDIRWLKCDIKSLNLLGSVLAKNEAYSKGAKEAILHRDGTVTEGSSTNVFIVKDSVLITHPSNHLILPGITRKVVLEIANKLGIEVKERAFSVDELLQADEAFTTSTTQEIAPVISLIMDDKTFEIGSGKPGNITKKLQEDYSELISKLPQDQTTV
jgi:D-alanine transaminase